MSWHYQIRKQIDMDGDSWYDIVEVYGKPFGHTIDGMTPGSETRAGQGRRQWSVQPFGNPTAQGKAIRRPIVATLSITIELMLR